MKKTKIAFGDIKPGDLIEVVDKISGVKVVETGVAFESREIRHGFTDWLTSQGGLLISDATYSDEDGTLYRIDVTEEDTFDDIRKGDLIRVTTPAGDTKVIVEGRAHRLSKADAEWYDYWESEEGYVLMHRKYRDSKVEIVERAEDNG
jgi:hypothetical protein